jgi:hypothetical protein
MSKPIESVTIPDSEAEYWDDDAQQFVLNAPSNFYILNSLGDRVFYKTKSRAEAQRVADEEWGEDKYTIRAVKDQKSKSKQESGGYSCTGSNSRKGFASHLKKS